MNVKKCIDINCDVGEGIGNEAELFQYISSCNVACGGHAGDETIMSKVVALAKKYELKVGAHPSYPDVANFGRISMDISPTELINTIEEQICNLRSICEQEQVKIYHIKAHGALYNDAAIGGKVAETYLRAVSTYKRELFLYVPAASVLEQMAIKEGFMVKREAFADRNYNNDLSLVSRNHANAIISEPPLVLEHLVRMVQSQKLITINQKVKTIDANTYCIHSDTAKILQILTYLSKELPKQNIYLQK